MICGINLEQQSQGLFKILYTCKSCFIFVGLVDSTNKRSSSAVASDQATKQSRSRDAVDAAKKVAISLFVCVLLLFTILALVVVFLYFFKFVDLYIFRL